MSSQAIVRSAQPLDVPGIAAVDRLTFGVERAYPEEFFYQQLALQPSLVAVAEVEGKIVGYVLGGLGEDTSEGWLLSLAVAEEWRRRGVARNLITTVLNSLTHLGVSQVLLSVDEVNQPAVKLYSTLGFVPIRVEEDFLGPAKSRVIMRRIEVVAKIFPGRKPSDLNTESGGRSKNPELLLGESQASIDFTNILFAVSLAVLAIASNSVSRAPVVGLLLFLVVTASFYSSIYYAIVAGNIARLERHEEVERAILYGNVLSEYFGVLLIVALLPLLVWLVVRSAGLAWLAYTVDLAGFALYTLSGFDLVGRPIPSIRVRCSIALAFAVLIAVLLEATIQRTDWLAWTAAGVLVCGQLILAMVHLRRTESQR